MNFDAKNYLLANGSLVIYALPVNKVAIVLCLIATTQIVWIVSKNISRCRSWKVQFILLNVLNTSAVRW